MNFDFIFQSISYCLQLKFLPYLVCSFAIFTIIKLCVYICTGRFFKKGGY